MPDIANTIGVYSRSEMREALDALEHEFLRPGHRRGDRSRCQDTTIDDCSQAATTVRARLTTRTALERVLNRSNESETPGAALVTDAELARARQDPAFRCQLASENLDFLINELNKLRTTEVDLGRAKQICEGVDLALELARRLLRDLKAQVGQLPIG